MLRQDQMQVLDVIHSVTCDLKQKVIRQILFNIQYTPMKVQMCFQKLNMVRNLKIKVQTQLYAMAFLYLFKHSFRFVVSSRSEMIPSWISALKKERQDQTQKWS